MIQKITKWCLVIISCFIVVSCNRDNRYFPPESEIEKQYIPIIRYDSAMLSTNVDTSTIKALVDNLYEYDSEFTSFYSEQIIGIPTTDTLAFADALYSFLTDTVYGFNITNQKEKELFSNIDSIRQEIDIAFSRISHLYPQLPKPQITLFVSGFNASLLFWKEPSADTDYIAIGTDMYLGKDYEYYNRVVYNYQKITMHKQSIPIDVVSAYMFRHFPFSSSKNRLIDNMIYRGKIMYTVSQILDTRSSADVMGYSNEQWQWCEKNESKVWRMMMDKHDLFKTESLVLTSYLNDGPFTAEISQDSPGRLGTWIGWRIVESYMKTNKQVDLVQLLEENDAQKILEMSNYKP